MAAKGSTKKRFVRDWDSFPIILNDRIRRNMKINSTEKLIYGYVSTVASLTGNYGWYKGSFEDIAEKFGISPGSVRLDIFHMLKLGILRRRHMTKEERRTYSIVLTIGDGYDDYGWGVKAEDKTEPLKADEILP